MCGIAGVRRFGNTPITREEIAILLGSLENRGNHATGIALANNGGTDIVIHKMPTPAWSFVKDPSTQGFLDEHLSDTTEIAILHTRFATVGDPYEDNGNNHPMYAGKCAIVHNGGIRNADVLFKSEKLTPSCETDSDYIRAVFDRDGFTPAAARFLSKGAGSGAIAAIHPDYPGVLALGRSGNPLVAAEANDKLYFASEMQAIHKAVRPWVKGKSGLFLRTKPPTMSFHNLPDDTLYYIPASGVNGEDSIPHYELKISYNFASPVYRSHETYADKKRTWTVPKEKDRIFTQCRKCGLIQSKYKSTEWANLACVADGCDQTFEYLQEAA